ncbi:SubName: Full=Putative uncharacterized protein {ECO:0000313/EMBL:ACT83734.1} [Serendipita indica DSM 11827]|uniref:Uncharacterized protein n=2 Tax=Serendipita indica TaxID=65672 RepID=G4TWH9_SERID|nr:hypothetical protein [Serendipita indica]CAG7850673.1 SubName: Full=Putative uncharacterized protein {ECO:0000313/EMBL:ACT83734.1} [Serendipita indica DSM 11827]CCA75672.1 hypothetical protein PIIN_09662 [Serendipita indica DSM 11827]
MRINYTLGLVALATIVGVGASPVPNAPNAGIKAPLPGVGKRALPGVAKINAAALPGVAKRAPAPVPAPAPARGLPGVAKVNAAGLPGVAKRADEDAIRPAKARAELAIDAIPPLAKRAVNAKAAGLPAAGK